MQIEDQEHGFEDDRMRQWDLSQAVAPENVGL